MKKVEVQLHAVKIMNTLGNYLFITHEESLNNPMIIDEAKNSVDKIISIPDNLRQKIRGTEDISGNQIRDLTQFKIEYSESFEYEFVSENELSSSELKIFNSKEKIFSLLGGKPKSVNEVLISENIKKEFSSFQDASGVYERHKKRIIIKRSQLRSIEDFTGTLIHEISHGTSRRDDVTREFEIELTRMLGIFASIAIITK